MSSINVRAEMLTEVAPSASPRKMEWSKLIPDSIPIPEPISTGRITPRVPEIAETLPVWRNSLK